MEEMASLEGEERAFQEKRVKDLLDTANQQHARFDPGQAHSESPGPNSGARRDPSGQHHAEGSSSLLPAEGRGNNAPGASTVSDEFGPTSRRQRGRLRVWGSSPAKDSCSCSRGASPLVTEAGAPATQDERDAHRRIIALAHAALLEEDGPVGPACFGPRIRGEPFPRGFTLPRDTPKYNGTAKREDWLIDYTTAVGIARGNKSVVVRYVPLMLAGSARTWLNSLPDGSVNSWVDIEEAFFRSFTGTYKRPGRPRELAMCVQKADEPLRDYVTRWTELCNSSERVHEVQAIEYFIDGCRDGTLLKHKLMCAEPTSLAVLMAKADKYATDDSAMRIKVTALHKVVPAPATPKPAGDDRGGQNNYKRKADKMANNKLVANVEGEASASQAGPPQNRRNQGNPNWQPRQSLKQLLDAPSKIYSGAAPSTHTLRQCSIACQLSQGEGMLAPPGAQAAPRAPAPHHAPLPPPPPRDDGPHPDDYPHQDGAFVVFTSEGDDKHNLRQRRREVNATVPPVPQYMHWSDKPITWSRVANLR
ncbi:hypothetical protein ZWY2020_057004 [Hordeum vulgare]|nr:hypothetical protein ZWY2020_057004 [Hordeum vulgare]